MNDVVYVLLCDELTRAREYEERSVIHANRYREMLEGEERSIAVSQKRIQCLVSEIEAAGRSVPVLVVPKDIP